MLILVGKNWDTGDEDHVEKPFNFDQEASTAVPPDAVSAKEQIVWSYPLARADADVPQAAIGSNSRPIEEQLQEKYPMDNSPLFSGKRIYQNGQHYWELTTLRLKVWAAAIVRHIA